MDAKRYEPIINIWHENGIKHRDAEMTEANDGEYVLHADYAKAIAQRDAAISALRAVEWQGWAPREDDYCCPFCRNPKYTKHHPNCQLNAVIRAAEGL